MSDDGDGTIAKTFVDDQGCRICQFCKYHTNAAMRACCERGRQEDKYPDEVGGKGRHVCCWWRTGPDTLFCWGCRRSVNEPEEK